MCVIWIPGGQGGERRGRDRSNRANQEVVRMKDDAVISETRYYIILLFFLLITAPGPTYFTLPRNERPGRESGGEYDTPKK